MYSTLSYHVHEKCFLLIIIVIIVRFIMKFLLRLSVVILHDTRYFITIYGKMEKNNDVYSLTIFPSGWRRTLRHRRVHFHLHPHSQELPSASIHLQILRIGEKNSFGGDSWGIVQGLVRDSLLARIALIYNANASQSR